MGKKKKKMKEELFSKDYSKITPEEQQRLNDLARSLMDGEYDEISLIDSTEEKIEDPVSSNGLEDFVRSNIEKNDPVELLPEEKTDLVSIGRTIGKGLGEIAFGADFEEEDKVDVLEDLTVVRQPKSSYPPSDAENQRRVYSAMEIASMQAGISIEDSKEETEEESEEQEEEVSVEEISTEEFEENYSEEENTTDEDEVNEGTDKEEDESTLENAFQIIKGNDVGDVIICDPYEDYKHHTINTFLVTEARTNYASSSVYNGMLKNIPFALAFIAGPILVLKPGNELFQNFISTVESYDKDHIFIVNRIEDTKGPDGKDVIDFLVYYIDPESISFIMDLINDFQSEESDSAIDFMYAIFKKAMDRRENPWCDIRWIDEYIDKKESQDDDVEYVMGLITDDEKTVINVKMDRTVNDFIREFTRPIGNYIDPDRGVFSKNCKMLKALLDDKLAPTDKNGTLIIPENFTPMKSSPKVSLRNENVNSRKVTPQKVESAIVYKTDTYTNTPFADALKHVKIEEPKPEDTEEDEIEIVEDASKIEVDIKPSVEETKNTISIEPGNTVSPAQAEVIKEGIDKAQEENARKNRKVFGTKPTNTMVVRYN